jgi:hypothetical protein
MREATKSSTKQKWEFFEREKYIIQFIEIQHDRKEKKF